MHRLSARVDGAVLLGVRVAADAVIDLAEHRRREAAGITAVIDPALLDRLLDLPVAIRPLKSPLTIEGVIVSAATGRELAAVQSASWFSGFTRRWVAASRDRLPDAVQLEAKLCGVGLLGLGGQVVLPAAPPASELVDKWSWLLEEKIYRRWLSQRSEEREMESRLLSTDEASSVPGR